MGLGGRCERLQVGTGKRIHQEGWLYGRHAHIETRKETRERATCACRLVGMCSGLAMLGNKPPWQVANVHLTVNCKNIDNEMLTRE